MFYPNRDTTFVRLLRLVFLLPLLSARHVTSAPNVTLVADTLLSNNAHWAAETTSLYYVEKPDEVPEMPSRYIRYDPVTKQIYGGKMFGNLRVLFIVPVTGSNNLFVISVGQTLLLVPWDGHTYAASNFTATINFQSKSDEYMITGKADSNGLLWVGSDLGYIYSVKRYGETTKHDINNISIPHAMAFSKHFLKLYILDSFMSRLMEYNYNLDAGTVSKNGKVVFDFGVNADDDDEETITNGLAIDDAGYAWIGRHDIKKIVQIDIKNKVIVKSVDFPDALVTSLAFGGQKLDTLYATVKDRGPPPSAGGVYQVTGIDAIGLPGLSYKYN